MQLVDYQPPLPESQSVETEPINKGATSIIMSEGAKRWDPLDDYCSGDDNDDADDVQSSFKQQVQTEITSCSVPPQQTAQAPPPNEDLHECDVVFPISTQLKVLHKFSQKSEPKLQKTTPAAAH